MIYFAVITIGYLLIAAWMQRETTRVLLRRVAETGEPFTPAHRRYADMLILGIALAWPWFVVKHWLVRRREAR